MYDRVMEEHDDAKVVLLSDAARPASLSEDPSFLDLPGFSRSQRRRPKWCSAPRLFIIGLFSWVASLALTAFLSTRLAQRDSFAKGFDTDLEPLRSALEIQKIKFKGNLDFDENGTLIATNSDHLYVGAPSRKLDEAWSALTEVDGVDLIGAEADSIRGKTLKKESGHYLIGIDGIHQIHCLNMLRKALRPDVYPMSDPEPIFRTHLNHCVDYIRQSLMCSIDITPLSVEWVKKYNRPIEIFEAVHTCRNFDKVKAWALGRSGHQHPLPYKPGRHT